MENLRQKLKLFNYRPLVLVFLGLVIGVLVANFIKRATVITIIGIVIALSVLIFYSVMHKKFKYIVIIAVTFVLGFSIYSIYLNTREHRVPLLIGKQAVGTVTSIHTYDECLSLLLEDVKIDGNNVKYNATVYYYNVNQNGYIKLEIGAKIKFTIEKQGEPDKFDEEGLPHTYNFKNNVGVELTTNEVELVGTESNVRTAILDRIRNNLRKGLNDLNDEMIYSAMFGDKTYLNHDLYDAYKTSGVAHLLAVSGLHVGLVTAIIYWLLRKCKIKNWYSLAIVVVLLLGYAYLCNFSYSIIRASIMAIIIMIAPLMFSEYDLLSSVCFAGSVILLIDPIALFDLSALLSFGCVFGIAMLHPIFSKWFKRVPLPSGVKDGFSISLATIISTSVIMAKYFGYIQPIGLISNIFIIPIFSVLFTITFIMAISSLILPFVSYALIFINPLFEWLNWAIIFIATNSKSLVTPSVNYLTILLFFGWLTFTGRYDLKKGINRVAIISVCTSIVGLQIALIK